MCIPFLIRNWSTGQEFELNSKEAFDRVYGDNPSWYIATGEHSEEFQRFLAEQAAQSAPIATILDGESEDV